MFRPKGFTLIELLVVIAIIGVLSTIVMASLTSGRAKARDSKRLSDLGQMSKLLNLNSATKIGFTGGGCATPVAGGYLRVNACTLTASGMGAEFAKFKDPSGVASLTGCVGAASSTPTTAGPCNYSVKITTAPNTQDYQICAWLETDAGPLKGSGAPEGGLIHITQNSLTPIAGCP